MFTSSIHGFLPLWMRVQKKKECPILSVILENGGVYSPLSALFDIVSSFVAGELAD